MKTLRRTQMHSFEGASLPEFTENFNESMEWVSRIAGQYEKPVVDIEHLRGYVIYEETVKIPEGYKDVFDLKGIEFHCGDCKHFKLFDGIYGKCPYVKFGKGVRGLLARDCVCNSFYENWEKGDCPLKEGGDAYEEGLQEYRRQNVCDAAGRDPR